MSEVTTKRKEFNLVTPEQKIDVEVLREVFNTMITDAERSNEEKFGQLAAARRFRVNSFALAKALREVKKITPKKK
jgi:hypothetical protein